MRNDTWQIVIGKPHDRKRWHLLMGPVSDPTKFTYLIDTSFKTIKEARVFVDKCYNVTWVNNKKAYLVTSSLETD